MTRWLLFLCVCAAAHKLSDAGSTPAPTKPVTPMKPEAPTKPAPVTASPEPPEAPTKPEALKPAPVTGTPSGAIRGSWMQARRGRTFQAYRGIRYAQPPIGELRFQPPVDIEQYEDEVDASSEGPACPLPTRLARYQVDEDCLRLNVYTPDNNSSRKFPVLLFIHPGGFYSMSGRSDRFGPHYLLDHDLVLVTINYRLASLGFLSTGDEVAPGNNGFKDQVSALRWVQRNIAAFGGDPALVTIAGCSAGGRSVLLHMVSPMSRGLFHRGIESSGAQIGKEPLPLHQYKLAQKQARILNCPTNSSRAIVDCLKTKTWQELGNSLPGFWDRFSSDPVGFWSAVVEPDVGQPRLLPEQPDDAIREGRFHPVPLLISQTEGEFFWKAFGVTRNKTLRDIVNSEWDSIAPLFFNLPATDAAAASRRLREAYLGGKDVADTPESARDLGRLYGDSWIGFNTHRTANFMCRRSPQPVWYSVFSYVGNNSFYQNPQTGKPAGAAHHDDLIYLFSMSYFRPPIPAHSPPPPAHSPPPPAHSPPPPAHSPPPPAHSPPPPAHSPPPPAHSPPPPAHSPPPPAHSPPPPAHSPPPPAPQDSDMVDRMTAIWYTFAKHGDPNPRDDSPAAIRGLSWPPMKPSTRQYLDVNQEPTVREKLHEDRLQVWEELYPMQY